MAHANYNLMVQIGRLAGPLELHHFESGSGCVANGSMAITKSRRDRDGNWQDRTIWIDIKIWGPAAERAAERACKGALVLVEGELDQDEWEDREGNKRRKHLINCRRLSVIEIPASASQEEPEAEHQFSGPPPQQPDVSKEETPW